MLENFFIIFEFVKKKSQLYYIFDFLFKSMPHSLGVNKSNDCCCDQMNSEKIFDLVIHCSCKRNNWLECENDEHIYPKKMGFHRQPLVWLQINGLIIITVQCSLNSLLFHRWQLLTEHLFNVSGRNL
ncbi:hypothetical protein T11_18112 [Trichinella zimbabwensis]|uniref:Uncharacterized protein n=1 Tax=Trichinella zimbabwensis TaxID=268475 RepID=A0A0V1H4T4_9BILA|nr:hypothetical protein T11_18112 [Trichinella zimbabwensis]